MPRVSQSVLLGAIAVFLAPPVNGFGGLNYLRSSSTNSRPITVPKTGGPSYLFMPVGDTDYQPDSLEFITAPSPPSPTPPPSTCCVVYPQGTCPNCYLNTCNDCCEYVQLWETHPTLQPYPPPDPPPKSPPPSAPPHPPPP